MKKVLFIKPENIYKFNNYPPLSLISLGTVLRQGGIDVDIINCSREKDPISAIGNKLDEVSLAGVTMLTSECQGARDVLRFVKSRGVPTVAGGWHCTLFPEQMAESGLIDFVVTGEGEELITDLYRRSGDLEAGAHRIFEADKIEADKLPLPEYDLEPRIEEFITGYLTDRFVAFTGRSPRWLPYESSRGCPSRCTFCINTVTDNNLYRKKSAVKVISEIAFIVKKYNIEHIKIVDDNFFVDINRARAIAEGMLNAGLNITWDAECRCDYFNDRMMNDYSLDLFKRSGLVQLTLGIESGSDHTLKIMKKDITVDQARHAVKKCDEYKIVARSSFMIEVPGEKIEDIKQTVSLVNELRKYKYFSSGVTTFRPYPKCELTDGLLHDGILEEPKTFDEWADKNNIELYTSSEHKRPWQVSPEYSESASYFLGMESEVRLGQHQIESGFIRFINKIFILAATIRNRTGFYRAAFDKKLYKEFINAFYGLREKREKDINKK